MRALVKIVELLRRLFILVQLTGALVKDHGVAWAALFSYSTKGAV